MALTPDQEPIPLRCEDGWTLAVFPRPARGRPRGVVCMGHAMMVDHRTLDRRGEGLAATLSSAGFHTLMLDVRGHGRSTPLPASGGNWRYDDIIRQDLPALNALARERYPGLPVAGLGHSLTAHAGLASLGLGCMQVDAFVSIAANTWIRAFARSRWDWWVKRATSELFRAASWPLRRFPARALGGGTDDVSWSYVSQSTDWARGGRWCSDDGAIDYHPGLAGVSAPVLAVHGAADVRLSSPSSSRLFHAPIPAVEHLDVSRQSFGYDADHMSLVTRPEGRPVWEAIATWLDATLPKPPDGPA